MYRKDEYIGSLDTDRLSLARHRKVVEGYSDADEYCVVHEGDRQLKPIWIPLPRPPSWHLIDGYGKPRDEQVFCYQEIPNKIKQLEREQGTIEGIWKEIEGNSLYYREEIEWIRKQIWHELNGYWFFCDGKPTYITGDHYTYLNFWNIDVGKPEYRDRDRKIWLFDAFIEKDYRFCGFNYPKHRREGATSKAGSKLYLSISRLINSNGGIQSKTEDDARKVFQNFVIKGWRKAPFWLKPEYDGTDNPKEILRFIPPATTASKDNKGKKSGILAKEHGLGSNILFESSDAFAFDGSKLQFFFDDEVGKTTEADTHKRYLVIKQCLSLGERFIGHTWRCSTVEEMDIQGGRNFKKTCQQSQYHDIFENDNGRTITGLATLFIPATEGLEGFIGPFGESIVDDPTESQLAFLKKNSPHKHRFVGSKQFLAEERAKYEEFGDSEGLMDFRRKFPIEYADCWISGSSDTGLPHDIILARMDELSMMMGRKDKKIVRRGNFKRVNSSMFGHVTFLDDENGRFELSDWFVEDKESNRFKMVDGEPVPLNINYGIAGGDPFKFTKNKDKRHSDGGGSVFMYRKPSDQDDNVRNWTGHRVVCAYRHKPPTKEEYCEDMAMMIQYYGVLMCSENNVPLLNDWLIEHGYRHYLKYLVNRKTGKFEVNPGVYTSDVVHQQIWSMTKDYLKMHGHRECHMGYLQECVDIEGVEQMGKYDLFAAVGMAMIGAEDMVYERVLEEEGECVDLKDWF